MVTEAQDRPDPALGYVHNDRPVPGARGRAPSRRQVPIIKFPYVGAFPWPRDRTKAQAGNTLHAGNNCHEHEDERAGFLPHADKPTLPYVLLGCVPEDSEEVAGSSGSDEQVPDEMAIRELLGQVKSDPAGVSETAGG